MPRKKNIPDSEILDVARDIFLRDGIAASTKIIAKVAGVSEGVLFQRFESKRSLFFRALRLPTALMSQPEDLLEGGLAPKQVLMTLTHEALSYLRNVMPVILLVLSHPARKDVLSHDTGQTLPFMQGSFELGQTILGFFTLCVERGSLPESNYEVISRLLVSTLLTTALHEQIGVVDEFATDVQFETIIDSLVRFS